MLDHARHAVGTALRGPLPGRYAMLRLEFRPLRSPCIPIMVPSFPVQEMGGGEPKRLAVTNAS